MRSAGTDLGAVDPKALVEARLQAHHAVQWVARAARANLPAAPDDSHSNLGWDSAQGALVSHALNAAAGGTCRVGLELGPMRLFLAQGAQRRGAFALDGCTEAEAGRWLDALAAEVGLKSAGGVVLPYVIPAHPVAAGARYACAAGRADFAALARWYDFAADVLEETRAGLAAVKPGPSAVRCWPHHFDLATLVTLGAGDGETAASIGIGLSPGDDYYAQPYFYISPWPAPAANALPELPPPGHWHSRDFIGAIATGDAVLSLADRRGGTRRFIDAAVEASRRLLRA